MDLVKVSKYISLLLRHRPEVAGLTLDHNGWCDTDALVEAVGKKFGGFDIKTLEEVVETNNKKRFSFNDDRTKIRANQGHSIDVDVELEERVPPKVLYHGSATKYAESIRRQGLDKRDRLHVHLSLDYETAVNVGKRHGRPCVYEIDCERMVQDGYKFYLSKNGVWLTDHVPFEYLKPLS